MQGKENMFEIPSDHEDSNMPAQNLEQVDFNWIQCEVDQIQKQIQQDWKGAYSSNNNEEMLKIELIKDE